MQRKNSMFKCFTIAIVIAIAASASASLEAAIPAEERAALVALYNTTNGDNWNNNSGWKEGTLEPDGFGPVGSENTWYGVAVSGDHVTGLYLDQNDLNGTIPPELANLSNLQWLEFYYNRLSGTIPPELGNLQNLIELNVGRNQLSGTIPPELGNIPTLAYLVLFNNRLTGNIPPELGNLTNLDWLDLQINQLTGPIPPELGKLTNLSEMFLHSNQLEGTIPPELGNLSGLYYLTLSSNKLIGEIPPELGNLSNLADAGSRFRYNGLYTENESLRNFLNSKQWEGDWESTQTIAPSNVSAGWISAASIRITWTPIAYTADGGEYEVYYSTTSGGPYTLAGVTADKSTAYYDLNGLTSGTTYYFVIRTRTPSHGSNSNEVVSEYSREASTVVGVPVISLNRTTLDFAYEIGGAVPASQTAALTCSSGLTGWTADADVSWLNIDPPSGTGSAVLAVSADPSGLDAGTYTGTLTVTAPDAVNSPQTVIVRLTVHRQGNTSEPFGEFATPLENTVLSGSVPVTGWALDDTGVENVKIYREEGEYLVYIGDAVFVEGARPDIETAYPGHPMNYRAGWGYMMLTNFLPDNGNGTFTLHAVAEDTEGNRTTLGTKTITCDNADAVNPFGAIDTPNQGGTASGTAFRNHGWVLTPLPNAVPSDGRTINVYVDGVYLGHPVYNIYRSDIAGLFPGYANSHGAHAYFDIDTTAYENGVHTIFWTAEDNAGNAEGIGSRYFTIMNSTQAAGRKNDRGQFPAISVIPVGYSGPVSIKRGYSQKGGMETIYPAPDETINIEIQELGRVELHLAPGVGESGNFTGYSVVGDRRGALPIGSTLQPNGVFCWHAGAAFTGEYRFVFVGTGWNDEPIHRNVKVIVHPKSE